MRDMEKFKQDEKNGLLIKNMRAGSKGLATTVVASAISRAMRRGRITKETARRCSSRWHIDLANRSKSKVWSLVANEQLLEAAKMRKSNKIGLAKILVSNARDSLLRSRQTIA